MIRDKSLYADLMRRAGLLPKDAGTDFYRRAKLFQRSANHKGSREIQIAKQRIENIRVKEEQ